MPKSVHEFLDYYGIKHTKTTATLYKAVRKVDAKYVSDHSSSFEYVIGETKTEECCQNTTVECSYGIHISHLDWALNYGRDWTNIAIIECSVKISDIVVPINSDGKVRASKVKVVREVPLAECGLYGEILAERLVKR
jgi:hypothetical protein